MLKHSIFIFLLISNLILGQSLSLEVLTSKNEYKFGEYIDLKVKLKNVQSGTVKMQTPRVSSGTVLLHLISSEGIEYNYQGMIMSDPSRIILKPGEEHEQQLILNELFGDFISVAVRKFTIKPGLNKLFAEMVYEGEKITSDIISFEVYDLNEAEKQKFQKFKALLDQSLSNITARKMVNDKIEAMFRNSNEPFREMALNNLTGSLTISSDNAEKIASIENMITTQYPNSFSSIRLLYSKQKNKRKEIVKEIIPRVTNEFYLKFYQKIIDEK